MTIDVKELASQMKEMEEKSKKYDELKSNIDTVMLKINDKFSEIQELFGEISPAVSIKKQYGQRFGGKVVNYITICYKHLVDSGDMFSVGKLLKKVGLEHIKGGSEHQVRLGLLKLKGIKTTSSDERGKIKMMYYDKSVERLNDIEIPSILSEKVKIKEKVKIDVVDDNSELMKSMPKKYSQLG